MSALITVTCAATLGCIAIILSRSRLQARTHPLPPGPPGLPWIGNVVGIDASAPWLTYSKWAKIYGDLIYTRLLGNEIIIINSEKVAKDLLEHHSRNYSDRPYLITNESCGLDFNSGLLPYGDRWRLHRRFFHETFRREASSRFHPLEFRQSCRLLRQLIDAPDQFSEHVFDYTTSLLMNSVYNYDPASRQDELVGIVAKVLEIILGAMQPEVALIIGAFPMLLHLPSWLPGMSFKKKMAAAKQFAPQYVERPFEYSVQKMLNTGPMPSMIHDSIRKSGAQDAGTDEAWMKELKGAAASAFLGGSETSNSVILTFFLMMVLNPEVQEKAHAQIHYVLGGGRLPTMADRPSLPYIEAILREVYRYNPVVPLSLPHSVVDDDVYSGYHIPKGAFVFTNLWSMGHDESKYPNPDKFIPERFLADDGSLLPNDTQYLAFGLGRRSCPGKHLADASVWSAISSVLAVFHISKSMDGNGIEIPVEPKFASGLTAHPLPFACSILPREPGMDAEKLEQLITATTITEQ